MGDLTTNFFRSEFACKCGCGRADISERVVAQLQMVREVVGHPLNITSGVRCEAHNKAVGGVEHSPHLTGFAADISVSGSREKFLLVDLAIAAGFRRVGVGRDFVHLDLDPDKNSPRLWIY